MIPANTPVTLTRPNTGVTITGVLHDSMHPAGAPYVAYTDIDGRPKTVEVENTDDVRAVLACGALPPHLLHDSSGGTQ